MIQKQAVVNIVRPSIPQDVADVKVLPVLDYPCKICPFFYRAFKLGILWHHATPLFCIQATKTERGVALLLRI